MAKTKQQKEEALKSAEGEVKDSKFLVFADFSETQDSAIKVLRRVVREGGSKFSVIKKRLLRVLFKKSGIDFDPVEKYDAHVGTIFGKTDISEVAPSVYKFSQKNPNFKLLGGYDLEKKEEITLETLLAIGRLPSREVLIAQVMGGLTGSVRKFMYLLTELANRGGAGKSAQPAEEPAPAEVVSAPAESAPEAEAPEAEKAEDAPAPAEGESQEEKVGEQ